MVLLSLLNLMSNRCCLRTNTHRHIHTHVLFEAAVKGTGEYISLNVSGISESVVYSLTLRKSTTSEEGGGRTGGEKEFSYLFFVCPIHPIQFHAADSSFSPLKNSLLQSHSILKVCTKNIKYNQYVLWVVRMTHSYDKS